MDSTDHCVCVCLNNCNEKFHLNSLCDMVSIPFDSVCVYHPLWENLDPSGMQTNLFFAKREIYCEKTVYKNCFQSHKCYTAQNPNCSCTFLISFLLG